MGYKFCNALCSTEVVWIFFYFPPAPPPPRKVRRKGLHIVSTFFDRKNKNIKLEGNLLIVFHIYIFLNKKVSFFDREKN